VYCEYLSEEALPLCTVFPEQFTPERQQMADYCLSGCHRECPVYSFALLMNYEEKFLRQDHDRRV
jgi:hypothetical protein